MTYREIQDELRELGLENFSNRATAAQYERIYDTILREVPKGAKVLDWGCGNGHLSYFLLRNGYQVSAIGMEVFSETELFNQRFPGQFAYYQAGEDDPIGLPYADNEFDATFSMGVLEHVRETGGDEVGSLKEHYRILKPGGKFLCFHFPNRLSYIEGAAKFFAKKHHHQFKYDRGIIQAMLDQAKLKLVSMHRYGMLPRNELKRLPKSISNSVGFVKAYNAVDGLLGAVLGIVAQNYMFVAKKPES